MFFLKHLFLSGLLFFSLVQYRSASAQSKSESDHIHRIIVSLQQTDSNAYADLFPAADTMTAITLRKAPSGSVEYEKAKLMRENPFFLVNQDTLIDKQAYEVFNSFIGMAKKTNIHWHDCILLRYELEALGKTRDAVLEAIAPERFVGFIFIEDIRTHKHYGFTVSDIMKIDGNWYGGELNNLYEAEHKDELKFQIGETLKRLQKGIPDTTEIQKTAGSGNNDEEPGETKKQVLERKLYTGMLDDEIPVTLYIRSFKGDCPEAACSWDALFKFGDQDEYTKPEVSRNEQGKWVFTEEESGAVMELTLKGGVFTGIFSATIDKVDYEAKLKETPLSSKKLEYLETIIDDSKAR